jgi:hypothetical protein
MAFTMMVTTVPTIVTQIAEGHDGAPNNTTL